MGGSSCVFGAKGQTQAGSEQQAIGRFGTSIVCFATEDSLDQNSDRLSTSEALDEFDPDSSRHSMSGDHSRPSTGQRKACKELDSIFISIRDSAEYVGIGASSKVLRFLFFHTSTLLSPTHLYIDALVAETHLGLLPIGPRSKKGLWCVQWR